MKKADEEVGALVLYNTIVGKSFFGVLSKDLSELRERATQVLRRRMPGTENNKARPLRQEGVWNVPETYRKGAWLELRG